MSLIFVFGSNTSGRHGKGAALTARRQFGAIQGTAEGLMGGSYAIPTCDGSFQPLPLARIQEYVDRFIVFADRRYNLGYKVTHVGCGLAYYKDEQIAPMFKAAPQINVFFDEQWRPYLGVDFEYWGSY